MLCRGHSVCDHCPRGLLASSCMSRRETGLFVLYYSSILDWLYLKRYLPKNSNVKTFIQLLQSWCHKWMQLHFIFDRKMYLVHFLSIVNSDASTCIWPCLHHSFVCVSMVKMGLQCMWCVERDIGHTLYNTSIFTGWRDFTNEGIMEGVCQMCAVAVGEGAHVNLQSEVSVLYCTCTSKVKPCRTNPGWFLFFSHLVFMCWKQRFTCCRQHGESSPCACVCVTESLLVCSLSFIHCMPLCVSLPPGGDWSQRKQGSAWRLWYAGMSPYQHREGKRGGRRREGGGWEETLHTLSTNTRPQEWFQGTAV